MPSRTNGKVTFAQLLARQPQREEVVVALDEEHTATFVFEAISYAAYDALLLAHQPTEDQRDELGLGLAWNPLTFPAAVVAASLVDPKLSESEVVELFTSPGWSRGEAEQLASTAIRVNNRPRAVALGKDSATIPTSPPEPATP